MKEIFEDIKIITEKGKSDMKDITWWGWYFTYKGKDYSGFFHNAMYNFDTISPIPTYTKIEITPEQQIDLFQGMVNMMKELALV